MLTTNITYYAGSSARIIAASLVSRNLKWFSEFSWHFPKAVSIATNSLVSITVTKMLLTPTRRVGVNIGQKSAIATNSSGATDATTLSVSTTATKALLAPT